MAARPRRRFALILLAGAAALAGCGQQGPDYGLKTPPNIVVAHPIETPVPPAPKGTHVAPRPHPTQRQAERLRPVLAAWAAAVRRGDASGAARYFALPAIVSQDMAGQLQTREQVRRFNAELPCGEQLLGVHPSGRYIVGTFRLTDRPRQPCSDVGRLSRVASVFRARRFTEWRQVPDRPNAPPGPSDPEPAPPPGGPGPSCRPLVDAALARHGAVRRVLGGAPARGERGVEERDQQADDPDDHEDQADRRDLEARNADVHCEVQDRADRDQEDAGSDAHRWFSSRGCTSVDARFTGSRKPLRT